MNTMMIRNMANMMAEDTGTYDLILKNILRVQAGEAPESCVRI